LSGRGEARTSGHFGHTIAFPRPNSEQQDLRATRILEDVKNVFRAIQLKKARAPRIRTRWRAGRKKQTQFGNLLRCVTPEVFEKRRLFCSVYGHGVIPPHIL
jgi:hypothetical protein